MIGKLKQKIKNNIENNIIKTPFLTSVYYAFSGRFRDEHFAVATGINKNKKMLDNLGNFRRNIHRIEKGLITVPSKPVFAEDYILETVETHIRFLTNDKDVNTSTWANGILTKYFESVKDTPVIASARKRFEQVNTPKIDENISPYCSRERSLGAVNYESFLKLCQQRRSVRYYTNQTVERSLIEKAIQTATLSPSACNRQPFQYRIIDDPELLKKAVKLPKGATTFADNIPVLVFLIGDLSNYFSERDRHLIYIDSSLSSMSFLYALETLGLSSCIINWSDISENNLKLKKLLNLDDWEQCILTISVGYAAAEGGIPISCKKDTRNIIKYN